LWYNEVSFPQKGDFYVRRKEYGEDPLGLWACGACGRGEDHAVRGAFICERSAAQAGARGSPGRVSGHRPAGTRAGHYHFLQAGAAFVEESGDYIDGYAGARRLFGGSGARAQRAGLRRAGHQRRGRRAGAYADLMEAVGSARVAGVSVHQQNGSARRGQGRAHARAAGALRGRLRGAFRAGRL